MRHHVDAPRFVPGLLGGLRAAHRTGHAGVRDEDVDRAVSLARLRDQRTHAVLIAGVELDRERPDLGGDRTRSLDVAVGDDERPRSLGREAPDQRPPDAAGAARDDDMPVFELHWAYSM